MDGLGKIYKAGWRQNKGAGRVCIWRMRERKHVKDSAAVWPQGTEVQSQTSLDRSSHVVATATGTTFPC